MSIALLVPTRGRPANVARVYDSAMQTAAEPDNLEVIFRRDADDPNAVPLRIALRWNVGVVLGPRVVLSECWNEAYRVARPTSDIFMHAGDDLIFRTPGWDTKVRAAFEAVPDRIVFVHGDDGSGVWGANFGTHGFLHRNWINAVGYFVPPYFSSAFNDTWLNDVANALGRRVYLADVVTEHLHWSFGKSPKDNTYCETEARGLRDNVEALYRSEEMAAQRARDAAKLRAVMA